MKFIDYVEKINEKKEDKILKAILKAKNLKELKKIRDIVWMIDAPNKIILKLKKALDIRMKELMLKEERIHSKDKRVIMGYIKEPKPVQYKMSDGKSFSVKPNSNGAEFVFDKDNFELSMTITDLVDAMGYSISKSKPGNITIKHI